MKWCSQAVRLPLSFPSPFHLLAVSLPRPAPTPAYQGLLPCEPAVFPAHLCPEGSREKSSALVSVRLPVLIAAGHQPQGASGGTEMTAQKETSVFKSSKCLVLFLWIPQT